MNYDFRKIEAKWQKKWEEGKVFEVFEVSEKKGKEKYYVLDMFPYPSGEGLHIGHAFVFSLGDIYARFKRLQGKNVLYPIGYDSLGLPAENAAIKVGTHPKKYTDNSIKNFMKQQKAMGWSYDWSRVFRTSDSAFYKWDQWIFLKMLEKGIAYRKKAPVNWCSECRTVLANEQVHNGKCWRHENTNVEIKHLEQWFFRITDYAEELLKGLDDVEWPERAKKLQRNWIGKSHGFEIGFAIENQDNKNSNAIIIHGCPSSKEKALDGGKRTFDKHWLPWTKKRLEEKGIKTSVPLMPEPWKPDYDDWKKEFEKNEINENTILIGHSCGSAFLVRWLGESGKKIKKLVLVAPAKKLPGMKKDKIKFYDFETNKNIKNLVGDIVIFVSDDESPGIKESVELYEQELGVKAVELKGKGHYTLGDMGTEEFPELVEKIVSERWPIFTTRPDTLFGVTFMVVSAQHSRLMDLVTPGQKKEVEKFLKKVKSTSEKDAESLEKEGVFTGSYAINPADGSKIPVWTGNFVLADYGCGMVMAVPAHDQRDFEFAKKYMIPVKVVINPSEYSLNAEKMSRAFTGHGKIVNSKGFDGLLSQDAISEIGKKFGKKVVNYKLRDWLISRQRYWGTPIPVVYCSKCGIVPVPEKELPVELPEKVKFGEGNPLATNEKWINAKCPKCSGKARRETDTMDTFVNSSWYFLRYCDPRNDKEIFDKKKVDYWCPINQYIGGPEHITMHLIYVRFYTKFLRDIGLLKFDEPALKYFTQGIVKGADGEKMSKSRGNVVEPFEMIKKYGADSLRMYLVSNSSPDSDSVWDDKAIYGSFKFVNKVYEYFNKLKVGKTSSRVESKLNKAIKEITSDVEGFRHNLAVIKLRALFDSFAEESLSRKDAESFLKLLHVYCPFVTEELWGRLGGKSLISLSSWPIYDEAKIDEKFEKIEEALEKTVNDVLNILKIVSSKGGKAEKIYVYVLPSEKEFYDGKELSKRVGKEIKVFAVNDSKKYDPTGKAKNSKPGKPAIFVE
nr:hypothetical protein [uncultured archaeon]AQS34148.1 hypothetical protein [uncultured archaeon]